MKIFSFLMHSSAHVEVGAQTETFSPISVKVDNVADRILPDFVDSGQRMHHDHLLFGYSHDVRGEDELAKTLRQKEKKHTVTKLIYSDHYLRFYVQKILFKVKKKNKRLQNFVSLH